MLEINKYSYIETTINRLGCERQCYYTKELIDGKLYDVNIYSIMYGFIPFLTFELKYKGDVICEIKFNQWNWCISTECAYPIAHKEEIKTLLDHWWNYIEVKNISDIKNGKKFSLSENTKKEIKDFIYSFFEQNNVNYIKN